ncbi:MAG: pyridoxamine 5'-phosphate oxidase family protein [Acidobacteriota bacterium]
MGTVTTIEQLERVVGRRPLGARMKTLPSLDAHCELLLGHSPFAVLGWADREGRARATAVGGAPGFAAVDHPNALRLTLPPEEGMTSVDPAVGVGMLFLIPGLGETLRINGTARVEDGELFLTIREAFVHCAKAVLRSSLWDPAAAEPTSGEAPESGDGPLADPAIGEWLARAPFLVSTSWDAEGQGDASPKGDPPGFVRLHGSHLLVPDRPGNRRTDTFHNLIAQPKVAVLVFVPGETRVLEVSGHASLTTEASLLETMAVQRKVPKIAMRLAVERARLAESHALAASRLWDPSLHWPAEEQPDMSAVFIEHVKKNRARGAAATAVRTLASKRLMKWSLAQDYEKNRY